jgi:hypothetical protein
MALKYHLVEDLEHGWTRGTAAGDSVPPLQRALGACLLRIAQLARQLPPAGFLRACMLALREQVAFDAAWWGEMTGAAASPPRNLLHASIGLRASFAQEWNRDLAPLDTFAQSTMTNLDTVFRASGGNRGAARRGGGLHRPPPAAQHHDPDRGARGRRPAVLHLPVPPRSAGGVQ